MYETHVGELNSMTANHEIPELKLSEQPSKLKKKKKETSEPRDLLLYER